MNGASAALHISDIPFPKPIGGVRVGLHRRPVRHQPDDRAARQVGDLDLVVAGTKDAIVMVEGGAREVPEEDRPRRSSARTATIRKHHRRHRSSCRPRRRQDEDGAAAASRFPDDCLPRGRGARSTRRFAERDADHGQAGRATRSVDQGTRRSHGGAIPEGEAERRAATSRLFDDWRKRSSATRSLDEASASTAAASTRSARSPAKSACCRARTARRSSQRGETQALVTVTLGTADDEQRVDDCRRASTCKTFMLHYNFPPFSVGEVRPMRGPGRREIGHGALAERALSAVLPP